MFFIDLFYWLVTSLKIDNDSSSHVLLNLTLFYYPAFPRYQRLRREAESGRSASCKNTYDQCPEWKGEGMCTSDQYKDYMMTVCPVTCDFCKGMIDFLIFSGKCSWLNFLITAESRLVTPGITRAFSKWFHYRKLLVLIVSVFKLFEHSPFFQIYFARIVRLTERQTF